MANKINKEIESFFQKIGVSGKFDITETEEEIGVVVESEDSGMIIGYHGDTLESIQLVLALILAKQTGEFKRVSLEVGDYRKNREEWLAKVASDSKNRAISENREIRLTDLKSWERRVVHLILSEDDEVVSESVGEGRDRVLVVRPK